MSLLGEDRCEEMPKGMGIFKDVVMVVVHAVFFMFGGFVDVVIFRVECWLLIVN